MGHFREREVVEWSKVVRDYIQIAWLLLAGAARGGTTK